MFNDRSNNYDFNKLDQNARTQVILQKQESVQDMTEAQKKLFAQNQQKKDVNKNILSKKHDLDVSNLPSSKYLQSFNANMTIEQAEQLAKQQEQQTEQIDEPQPIKVQEQIEQNNVDFEHLIEQANSIKVDEKIINSQQKNVASAPKKNYSFRIKLVAGVYCILVALFGGWVIGNAIDIAHTNANLYDTISSNQQVSAEIEKIVIKIKNFDNASKNPEDESVLVEMGTEVVNTIPEEIIEPTEYVVESNWFDVLCNWLSKLFGAN